MAAQDFRHTVQREGEPVSDFICHLERSFTIAYGRDDMSEDSRSTLLYGQLQEGLCYEMMKSPGVSGAQSYKELCVAVRNEEKRQVELRKKQKYGAKAVPVGGAVTSAGQERTFHPRGSHGPERLCYVLEPQSPGEKLSRKEGFKREYVGGTTLQNCVVHKEHTRI